MRGPAPSPSPRPRPSPSPGPNLQNENAIAARHLEHEGIIAPQTVVRRQGRTEVQMEYAPGGNLGEYARRKNGLSESEARRLFRQIVDAVGYLHAKVRAEHG